MIFYILSHKVFTGGPESLHQLGNSLRKQGVNAKIYYVDDHLPLPKRLEEYAVPNVHSLSEIIDVEENILIVPEDCIEYFKYFKKIKKCIWWLSLHYYLVKSNPNYLIRYCLPQLPKWMYIFPRIYISMKGSSKNDYYIPIPNDGVFHLYNCEYVRQYLMNCNIPKTNTYYLCGPIESIYFEEESTQSKENIVIYNPKKGIKFSKKIIKELNARDVKTIPIQNMSAQEIKMTMAKSKIYMDFGFFPGPERIPREAVLMNCNLITSLCGSAENDIDIPIPRYLKYDIYDKEAIRKIVSKIEDMLINYESEIDLYDKYRDNVILQRNTFDMRVGQIIHHFGLKSQIQNTESY